ncbi:MAG: sulfatase-like hydrolase/transferase [Pirellulales bacterium]
MRRRPDVVLLVLEDVSPERFGTYGNPICKTPNLDRLASQGMRFDRFYTTPPCCPARTSMITGMRPESTKVFDNSDAKLTRELFERVTILPELFRKHGYETVRIGKFAHDDHRKEAWSRIVSRGEGRDADDKTPRSEKKAQARKPEGPHADPKAKFTGAPFLYGATGLKDEEHDDYHTAGAAVKVLGEAREEPLFLAVGFHADHLPFQAPDAYFAMYPPEQMPLPRNPGSEPDGLPTKKQLLEAAQGVRVQRGGLQQPDDGAAMARGSCRAVRLSDVR